jgi:hypothetical protein
LRFTSSADLFKPHLDIFGPLDEIFKISVPFSFQVFRCSTLFQGGTLRVLAAI